MQFSIRTLLAVTLAAALVCGVFFALPDAVTIAAIHLLYTLTLPVSIAGVVYGRRAVRAFFLGCLVSVTPFALMVVAEIASDVTYQGLDESLFDDPSPEDIVNARASHLLLYAYALLFGGASAAVYWWLQPRGELRPSKEPPTASRAPHET